MKVLCKNKKPLPNSKDVSVGKLARHFDGLDVCVLSLGGLRGDRSSVHLPLNASGHPQALTRPRASPRDPRSNALYMIQFNNFSHYTLVLTLGTNRNLHLVIIL